MLNIQKNLREGGAELTRGKLSRVELGLIRVELEIETECFCENPRSRYENQKQIQPTYGRYNAGKRTQATLVRGEFRPWRKGMISEPAVKMN